MGWKILYVYGRRDSGREFVMVVGVGVKIRTFLGSRLRLLDANVSGRLDA